MWLEETALIAFDNVLLLEGFTFCMKMVGVSHLYTPQGCSKGGVLGSLKL